MPAAINEARTATLRRACASSPLVTPIKAGASPIGSTTNNSVTKAERMKSGDMACGLMVGGGYHNNQFRAAFKGAWLGLENSASDPI